MKVNELLATLLRGGIELQIQDNDLRFRAPKGALTPELRQALATHKTTIITYLAEGQRYLQCSFAQERLWFLHQLNPDRPVYHVPLALQLTGNLNLDALTVALNQIMARHETLRTTFDVLGGVPVQMIHPVSEHTFVTTNRVLPDHYLTLINRESASVHSETIQQGLIEAAQLPFNLQQGPLFRATLWRTAPDNHILLLNLHHIITDGWSVQIMWQELATLYNAAQQGHSSPLAPLPLQFAQYTQWQRRLLQGEGLEADLDYWRQQLGMQSEPVVMATDYPRPAESTYDGAHLSHTLSPALSTALRTLSQQENATLYMTLLAVFQVLLSRYTGQNDILVGSPVANRKAETEQLLGFFVNTLVLRGRVSPHLTFRHYLKQVRDTTLEAFAHQDLPFERLVEALQPQRLVNYNPLTQYFFMLENKTTPTLHWAGLDATHLEIDLKTSKFDLSLTVVDEGSALTATFTYNTHLFAPATIQRLLGHLETLLQAITHAPDQPLASFSLLTPVERQQLLEDWPRTQTNYPRLPVHQLFEAQVDATPTATALIFAESHLTYAQLEQWANQLAHRLRRLGVGPDVLVGLFMERSLELIVATLAILKAGGAYLPLDTTYPEERLRFMLADSGSPVLLTQSHLRDRLPQSTGQVICLDTDADLLAQESAARLTNTTTPDNLAYVMYTSGSTGQPKGVSVIHRNIVRLVKNNPYTRFAPDEVFLQVAPVSFDAATFEIWGSLLNGATLVVFPPHTPSLAELGAALRQHQVTTLWLTAGLFHLMVDEQLADLRGLKQLLAGGDVLSVPHVRRVLQQLPNCRLINGYGPTEGTTFTTCFPIQTASAIEPSVPIGWPIANTQTYILDVHLQPVPVGVPGELHIGGDGLARNYHNRPNLTAERFIPHPFSAEPGARLYKTGDLVRYRADGSIQFLGRRDHQVKIRGFRIELSEIEIALSQHPAIQDVVVMVRQDTPNDKRLVAYVVLQTAINSPAAALRQFLAQQLPPHMVPDHFIVLDAFPLDPNGKVDRRALPAPEAERPELATAYVSPQTELEQQIAAIWQDVLHLENVGVNDNFFDLGGHSLLLIQVHSRLREQLEQPVSQLDLLKYPTIRALARHLRPAAATPHPAPVTEPVPQPGPGDTPRANDIAIIGMSGRWAKAQDVTQFWHNLTQGVEGITFFDDETLRLAGVPSHLLEEPDYVKARGVLENYDKFDAAFFGYTPREAEITDPQQRIFLECAWEALEDAGYAPGTHNYRVGVYAGSTLSSYLWSQVWPNRDLLRTIGSFQAFLGNDGGFLTTRVSYKLDLKGPSLSVQTACSTSLVAVHLACQSLLNRECDIALSGGISIDAPQISGYLYREGSIDSPDGHCRPFDAQAKGTVSGSGAGIVVLKRLEQALADGDTVLAVIKGSAVNNDGSFKVGYTAPGIDGQAEVIRMAQKAAGVTADSIRYVEAHGTATPLGDPIEVAALTQAFAADTSRPQFCALGSVKGNLGHLDAAAGVTGLIKTVLSLQHQQIPPTLHFQQPNPKIDFAHSPFYVNDKLTPWPATSQPRRAGVSAFGIGGTNAHVIIEEAPQMLPTDPSRPWQLLVLSARTASALETATDNLATYLAQNPDVNLADVAYTLQRGRKPFPHRRILVASSPSDAAQALTQRDPKRLLSFAHPGTATQADVSARQTVFLFPGQGAQHINMARHLYEMEPFFRQQVDECAALLKPYLELDLRDLLFPTEEQSAAATEQLTRTSLTQPALFTIEYALARLWQQWGITPTAMLGHSIGEYVAACLAGVFSLEDALKAVLVRGRLMEQQPAGAMLAVTLSETSLQPYLTDELSLAASNAPELSIVAGPFAAIDALEQKLGEQGIKTRRLHTSHAFHSSMMDAAMPAFQEFLSQLTLRPPQIPFLSNVSGTWITAEQATDPAYWASHIRQPVRFRQGLQVLFQQPEWDLLEVGPGVTLSTLTRQQMRPGSSTQVLASLPHPQETISDAAFLLTTLGRLWLAGHSVVWEAGYANERRRRIPLPTYPFEQQRYWLDAPREQNKPHANGAAAHPPVEPMTEQVAAATPVLSSSYQRPNLPNAYVAPHQPAEQQLAAIWEQHLGIQPIGIHDNFFELGGHSLLATQIVAQVREAFRIDLPLNVLFELPTVAEMAQKVTDAAAPQIATSASITAPLTTVSRQEPLPLSFSQERQWFLDQFEPGSSTYNVPALYHLTGPLDTDALVQSFNTLITRHESLRTNFIAAAGRPSQIIHPQRTLALSTPAQSQNGHTPPGDNLFYDLSAVPAPQQQTQAQQLIENQVQRPFNLAEGPLMRVTLLRLAEDHHLLAISMHHIITDGWSLNVLIRELTTVYQAVVAGQSNPLPPLAIQYADFAAWQRQWLQSEDCQRQITYWQQQLKDVPVLQLPTDRPRPPVRTYRVTRQRMTLPVSELDALHRLSNQEGGTLYMTLLAGLKTLFHHYTGQDDICVGSFIANRNRPETRDLIGFFVNNLGLRTDLSGQPSGRDLLHRVRQTALEAYAHQDLPFEKVLEIVQPERTLSHAPIFQVMCVLQNFPHASDGLAGLAFSPAAMAHQKSDFDLTVWMQEKEDELLVEFEYNPDLFDATTISRMQQQYRHLLAALAANPAASIADLPFLDKTELAQLRHWQQSPTTFPLPADLVPQQFEAQVARTPQAIALTHEGRQLTYQQLNEQINRLAHLLLARGIGPESRVAIFLERTPDMIVALLAVLKSGAAYIPLDPQYPTRRTADILGDTNAAAILTHSTLHPALPTTLPASVFLCLDELQPQLRQQPTTNPAVAINPDNLAYIIYTSGSTGRPKGVTISHAALLNYTIGAGKAFTITPADRVLQFASLSFDTAVEEIYPSLVHGATLVLRTDAMLGSEQAFVEHCQAWGITVLDLPTAYWHQLNSGLISKGLTLPASLRLVIIGGERALPEQVAAWRTHFGPQVRLWNTYGPTETTVVAISAEMTPTSRAAANGKHHPPGERPTHEAPIGRPVANTQAYILNQHLRPVGQGVPGELYLGGRDLARGYWQDPRLTAERFIPNPLAEQPGERIYRTGDLARYRPDGQIEFLGRVDHQVKIRGYRVEPGEIENCLTAHPAVREAAVVVHQENDSSLPRLVAYLVSTTPADETTFIATLRQFVRETLPDYMVPAGFVVLNSLPLTTSGKLDRRHLPAPTFEQRLSSGPAITLPSTPEEEILAEVWSDLLERPEIGVHDNFFDLGGHSLLATQLISRIRDLFHIEMPLRALFETPTIAALAVAIDELLLAEIEQMSDEEVTALMEMGHAA